MSFLLKKLDSVSSENPAAQEEDLSMLGKSSGDTYDSAASISATETNLSADASFKGTINFKSSLRIDGKFEGEIHSKGTLFIGKTGLVKADVKVGSIIVEGKIHGNIEAENKVDLRASAQMYGDIRANKLIISEGVSFVGNCNVNPNNEAVSRDDKGKIEIAGSKPGEQK